MCAIH
jgi:hypothetical protein